MNRFFGKKKQTAPPPTLDDASSSIGGRLHETEQKIKAIDQELLQLKGQMSRMKNGPAKQNIQRRAVTLLKQKKMYEKHRDTMFNQQFNIDQTKFTQSNLKDTAVTVAAMKQANQELKTSFKEIDLDDIEDLHDDMEDMMYMQDEINEVMGRSFATEMFDDQELLGELDELEDEFLNEDFDEVPNYLVDATTSTKDRNTYQEQQQSYDYSSTPIVRDVQL